MPQTNQTTVNLSKHLLILLLCFISLGSMAADGIKIATSKRPILSQNEVLVVNEHSQCLDGNEFQFVLNNHNYNPNNQYLWEFGPDANPSSHQGLIAPPVTFNNDGRYLIMLNILDSIGDSIGNFSKQIDVYDFDLEIIRSSDTLCLSTLVGLTVNLTNLTPGMYIYYKWYIENYQTLFTNPRASYANFIYGSPGNYQVILRVSTEYGGGGCAKYDTVNLVIIPDLDLDINVISEEIDSCYGNQLFRFELENAENYSDTLEYSWWFGAKAIPNYHLGLYPPLVRFTKGGLNEVVFTAFNEGCALRDTTFLSLDPVPFDFSYSQSGCEKLQVDFVCNGLDRSDYIVKWAFGDGTTSNEYNPSHVYTNTANRTVVLTVQLPDSANCEGRYIVFEQIKVNRYSARVYKNSDTLCISYPLSLYGTIPIGITDSVRWNIQGPILNNPDLTNALIPAIYFKEIGRYRITFNGYIDHCLYAKTTYVQIAPEPVDKILVQDSAQCIRDNAFNYSLLDPYPYGIPHDWDFGEDANPKTFSGRRPPPVVYSSPGIHQTILTSNAYGCISSDTVEVYVDLLPEFSFNHFQIACEPNSIVFESTGYETLNSTIEWDFGDRQFSTNDTTTHQFEPGTYQTTLSVTIDEEELCYGTYDTTMEVVVEEYVLELSYNDDTICITQALELSGLMQYWLVDSSKWIIDGELVNNPNLNTFNTGEIYFKNTGDYKAICMAFIDSCIYYDTLYITVVSDLTDYIKVNKIISCVDDQNFEFSIGDSSTIAVNYLWDFGLNGSPPFYSGSNPPTINFSYPDTFDVFLEIESRQCLKQDTIQISVEPVPIFDFSYKISGCSPYTVYFELFGDLEPEFIQKWGFGDGDSSSLLKPIHSYNTGNYIAEVTIQIPEPHYCSGDYIVQYPVQIDSVFTRVLASEDSLCISNPLDLTGDLFGWPTDSSKWIINGTLIGNPNLRQNELKGLLFADTGNFKAIYYAFVDTCVYTDTVSLKIYPPPLFVIDANETDQCLEGQNYQFNISGLGYTIDAYHWDFGPNAIPSSYSGKSHPKVKFLTDGTHKVYFITERLGCYDSAYVNINLYKSPVVDFSGSLEGCEPYYAQFKNYSTGPIGSSYLWDFGDGAYSTGTNPRHLFDSAGLFDVSLTLIPPAAYVCREDYTLLKNNLIKINPKPVINFRMNHSVTNLHQPFVYVFNDSWQLGLSDFDMGDGTVLQNSNADTIHHTYSNHGTYTITQYLITSFGCKDTLSRQLTIEPVFSLFRPNAFTPNDDGINDSYVQKGVGLREGETDYFLQVYNRWGEMIFATYDSNKGWDGNTPNGFEAKPDIYIYKVTAIDVLGKEYIFKGEIALIR
ncbi:MAG: gliding motility-associated-like protein [Candidatus Azotimanducaceae bacterium]|jgi:gliding motility-associated-like protein